MKTKPKFISHQASIESTLLENQKLFIDRVARYFASMNICQIQSGMEMINQKKREYLLPTIRINRDLPINEDLENQKKKNFNEEQELLKSLSKWYMEANPFFGFGSGNATPATTKVEDKGAKKEEQEKKVEKEIYDLELTTFDAAKKIGLIKEVRTLTNLGLKEVNISIN